MSGAIITMGAHVLDVLVRPVEEIPAGQGSTLVEDIRITAAGTAGGTALTLAKLGANVRSAGALGYDATGDMLELLLEQAEVDTEHLVRRSRVQTSATVLPIRPNGDRPTFHSIGANASYGLPDIDVDYLFEHATHLHLGGPELLEGGSDTALAILTAAKEHGLTTSVDFLATGEILAFLGEPAPTIWAQVDHLLPNEEQVAGLTGTTDIEAGAQQLLAHGAGVVAVTCGADGAVVVSPSGTERVPAFAVEVVDTTGCGDAFSAGFIRAVSLGRDLRAAAVLGSAAAAHVAQGLGSDAGTFDLASLDEWASTSGTRS